MNGPQAAPWRPPRGLYVHVPFCEKICYYCDFNRYLLREGGVEEYLAALESEAELYAASWPQDVVFDTVYIGGGTPTSLTAAQLQRLLAAALGRLPVRDDAEITVEANPGTLTEKKLAALRGGGVNRLSLGVQTLNDQLLRSLGRIHTARHARDSYERARAWFDNVSVDLMYGLPGQDEDDWRATLTEIARWRPEHLSCYGLIIEEGTVFGDLHARGQLPLPGEEREVAMYQLAIELLAEHGYQHYEISNWSLPGRESRHNRIYWLNGDWLGLGPGAHSQWNGSRFANVRRPDEYARSVAEGRPPVAWREMVGEDTAQEDTVILGLRLLEGVDDAVFVRRFGVSLADVFPDQVRRMTSLGLLRWEGGRLSLTPRGLLLSNQVFQEFIRV